MTDRIDVDELGGFERRLLSALTVLDEDRSPAGPVTVPPGAGGATPPRRASSVRRRALVVAASVAAVLAVGATAVAVLLDPPTFQLAGDAVVVGTEARVKGSGCAAGGEVAFLMDDEIALGSATATAEGLFVAALTIPDGTTPGPHDLTATCADDAGEDLVQRIPVAVLAGLPPLGPSLAGEAAVEGGAVTIKGSGCQAASEVTLEVDGEFALGTVTASDGGTFSAQLALPPSVGVGTHELTAACVSTDGRELIQHAELLVVAPEPEGPATPKP